MLSINGEGQHLPQDAGLGRVIRWGRAHQQMCRLHRKLDPNLALRVPWTKAEDAKLLALQESHGNHWADMAKHLKGRNAQMCRTRQALSHHIWHSCHSDTKIVHTPNVAHLCSIIDRFGSLGECDISPAHS